MNNSYESEILVWMVEDHDKYRATVEQLIDNTDGMRLAHSFAACEEALKELNRGFAPEVVLMDINLPGMNGIEGAARIKARVPSTQIIMLTNHEDSTKVYDAIRAGASGYLLKTSPTEIIAAIKEVRGGGAPMTPRIAARMLTMFKQLVTPAFDYSLSDREKEVLELMAEGLSKEQIADKMFLSPHTVASHTKTIYKKLHVNSAPEAVAKAIREHVI